MVDRTQPDAADPAVFVAKAKTIDFENCLRMPGGFGDEYLEGFEVTTVKGFEDSVFLGQGQFLNE